MSEPPSPAAIVKAMIEATPFARALSMEMTNIGPARVCLRAPYDSRFVGDPETGVIAGGVITALLDHVCGAAVMAAMTQRRSIATLDLRIDYMRGATPGRDIFAEAHCYKITRSVAFVRAVAFDDDPDDPVANAAGAFMIADGQSAPAGANRKPPR